jgi:hypothetical protein
MEDEDRPRQRRQVRKGLVERSAHAVRQVPDQLILERLGPVHARLTTRGGAM